MMDRPEAETDRLEAHASHRRWRPRRAAALVGLLFCAPALGQQSAERSESRAPTVVERFARSVEELSARAQRAAADFEAQTTAPERPRGVALLSGLKPENGDALWTPLKDGEETPECLVLLVHGLDEPGPIWDDLAPALVEANGEFGVARFDYPNDQPVAASTNLLISALRDLRARGTARVDLVCHSMGGLMARDALTRAGVYGGAGCGHEDLPDVCRLIMVGTPNAGSPWSKLRALGEIREQIARFLDDPDHDARGLLGYLNDGLGEAGDDLLPGSAFLTDLNARPMPEGVAVTVIAGRLAPVRNEDLEWIAGSWLVRQLLGSDDAAALAASIRVLSSQLGDGVVPVSSAVLPGVADTVYVEANHRSMLRTVDVVKTARTLVGAECAPPPAIGVIVERLSRSEAPARPRGR